MAIESETVPGASEVINEEGERAIYDRLIAEINKQIAVARSNAVTEENVHKDLYGNDNRPAHFDTHIRQSEIKLYEQLIEILSAPVVDRTLAIRWLNRKIENEAEGSPDIERDKGDLQILMSLEHGRDEKMAA